MKWLRLWTDIIDDPKLRRLTDVEFRHFVFLLALCAECEDGGAISMDDSDICWRLRIDQEKFNETKAKLESLGIIEVRDNSIRFVNWEKRQPAKDDSIERVRRFRERAKQNKKHSDQNSETDAKNNVTEIKPGCNEAVTEVKRSCNAYRYRDRTEQKQRHTHPPYPPRGRSAQKRNPGPC